MTKPERNRLPDRRPCVTVDSIVSGQRVTVGVGFDPATMVAMEAFCDVAKGSDTQHTVADACTAVSVALQWGVPAEALESPLGTVPAFALQDGEMVQTNAPASAVGAVLRVMREVQHGVWNDPEYFKDDRG